VFVTKKKYNKLFIKCKELIIINNALNTALVKKLEPGYVCVIKINEIINNFQTELIYNQINALSEKYYGGERVGLLFIASNGAEQKILSKRKINED